MKKYNGFYGEFGGQFVPETLIPALEELETNFYELRTDVTFNEDLKKYLSLYAGRPTPVYFAENLSKKYDMKIYLKREDLLHTGAHKINNAIGQALLAKYMGKKRIIAETGAGQHGVATATVAALLGLECMVYMGKVDASRQRPNLQKMKLLGADINIVEEGQQTLKEAINATLKDWVKNVRDSYYLIGSAVGPHPYPEMVAFFQSIIGNEARDYFLTEGGLPNTVIACVGGGSNAIGIFKAFIPDKNVGLIGVEAGGVSNEAGKHSRTLGLGQKGILHGSLTYLLQDEHLQVLPVHSISAGLDYPAVGPEHSYLKEINRVEYVSVTDNRVINAVKELSRLEGIIPALESSHAIAYVLDNAATFRGRKVLINLSGRGDKDMEQIGGLI